MNKPVEKPAGINRYTGRPNAAYPKEETRVRVYVNLFSRALGLKPTPTQFGAKVVTL